MNQERHAYIKSGYLHDDFRIFHLQDHPGKVFEYHYHDFHKVLFLLKGCLNYYVEGCCYEMEAGDVILIPSGEVHRPELTQNHDYERLIFYISPEFAQEGFMNEQAPCSLLDFFEQCKKKNAYLLRPDKKLHHVLSRIVSDLIDSMNSDQYAASLYQRVLFIEALIQLNRGCLHEEQSFVDPISAHPVVQKAIVYIQENIQDPDLNVDRIAEALFVSRSYLMHLFKAESGYSIGNYLSEKRLFLVKLYTRRGLSISDALELSGFKNYAAFYYARNHVQNKDRVL